MNTKSYTWILLAAFCSAAQAPAPRVQHKLVYNDDGTFGYRDTPTQSWSGYRVDDPDRPKPQTVDDFGSYQLHLGWKTPNPAVGANIMDRGNDDVLVQYNQEIYGPTGHATLPRPYQPGRSRAPLALGAHNNPVRFRHIWIRPL